MKRKRLGVSKRAWDYADRRHGTAAKTESGHIEARVGWIVGYTAAVADAKRRRLAKAKEPTP